MQKKKILVISYYWPPSGGVGVHRWMKFSTYLPQHNWSPIVYAPSNAHYPILDETLEAKIPTDVTTIRHPIWEPYGLYNQLMGAKKDARVEHSFTTTGNNKGVFKKKLSSWIRGNFFIPDARKFWIKPSIRFLLKYLKENPVDAIVSTGPPNSMHLIALGIKQKTGLPWMADFRDPWTEMDFFNQLYLTKWAETKHRRLEKEVLTHADTVLTVSGQWKKDLMRLGAKRAYAITNGFDSANFSTTNPAHNNHFFEILHIGSLPIERQPAQLWPVLQQLLKEVDGFSEKLKITLIGKTDPRVVEEINKHGLADNLNLVGQIPHGEVFEKLINGSVLLLPLNHQIDYQGLIPAKLFEYLAAKRPILCVGPTSGDTAKIIKATNAGQVIGINETDQLQSVLQTFFKEHNQQSLNVVSKNIDQYSRENLTARLAELLDEMVG